MRICLKAILLVGLAAMPMMSCEPAVQAADLGVTTAKKARVIHHNRLGLVRDYDGTPVVVHLGPAVRSPDGAVIVRQRAHIPVAGPQPLYYFNGEPVRSAYIVIRPYSSTL